MNDSTTVAKLNKNGEFNTVKAHCCDVAALAEQLTQRQSQSIRDELCNALGLDERSMVAWVALIAGLHDLVKYSWSFQLLRGIDEKFAELNGGFDSGLQERINAFKAKLKGKVSPVQHAILLAAVLPDLLVQTTGITKDNAEKLTHAAVAHHSLFIDRTILNRAEKYLRNPRFRESDFDELRLALVQHLWDELSFDGIGIPSKVEFGSIHRIAGLIQQADHTGSREHRFPLQNGACQPFEKTRLDAAKLLDTYGIQTPVLQERPSFETLGFNPRAMQEAIAGLDLTGPFALFVKAGTGNGKTAAAIQAAFNGDGFVFGANNQSTANSIHQSVQQLINAADENHSQAVALAHANRGSIIETEIETLLEDDPSKAEEIRGRFELQSEGLMDALTSKFVVATIDQLLMSVFNDGRAAFRLHWLTSKINILDEVHSLDGRLEALLLKYLEVMGRFRTPVILLSATISSSKMNKLLGAWARGAGIEFKPVTLESDDQVILVKPQLSEPKVVTIDKGKTPEKIVKVNWFDGHGDDKPLAIHGQLFTLDPTQSLIHSRSLAVPRLAWLGATAKEVQRSFRVMRPLLEAEGKTPICFHARFTPNDRSAVQREIFRLAGPQASEESQLVLFTTSVFRESLNLDVDELITFSGLMPEMIQALGRVHRFERPDRQCKVPQIHIARPFILQGSGNAATRLSFGQFDYLCQCLLSTSDFGFRAFFALRTFAKLQSMHELRLPFDGQALVDDCFNLESQSFPTNLPDDWKPFWESFKARQLLVEQLEADTVAEKTIPTDFDIHSDQLDIDFLAKFTKFKFDKIKWPTRLIEGSLSFFVQDAEDDGMVRRNSDLREIACRTVSVSNQQRIIGNVLSTLVPDEWSGHRVLSKIPRLIVDQPTFVQDTNGRRVRIIYTRSTGLEID